MGVRDLLLSATEFKPRYEDTHASPVRKTAFEALREAANKKAVRYCKLNATALNLPAAGTF